MTKFIPTIGLEIHAELKTKTKMFCSNLNDPDERHPNINICPVCTAQPGSLPVINKKAVESVIKVGLALNCQISERTFFERKNYFYPDLPKNYQISQYQKPLCENGFLDIVLPAGSKKIKIGRVHLEEDTGRLLHIESGSSASSEQLAYSLVDFNRAGIPLMELVTEPAIETGEEAKKFCEELQLILRYLEVSEANMEKGQMRCEVNISLRPETQKDFGTKVEIKNLNSFKSVKEAIDYEIQRQTEILAQDKKVIQETRGFDENKGVTFSQRLKEEAFDYRYFPEPDLPPLYIEPISHITEQISRKKQSLLLLSDLKARIPELPSERRERFREEYQLPEKDIEILVINKKIGDYFEGVASDLKAWDEQMHLENKSEKHFFALVKIAVNYLLTDLMGLLTAKGDVLENLKITPENFAQYVILIHSGQISSAAAKVLLEEMYSTGREPEMIVKEKDLLQVSDLGEIDFWVDQVLKENEKAVADLKKGKENALEFLVGQVMKLSRGKANPDLARKIIKEKS